MRNARIARRRHIIARSSCGKRQEQVRRLIAGPNGVFICDECMALCNRILEDGRTLLQPPSDSAPSEPHTT